jgi:ribosomal protein L7Ae-like RNA K-turn-binding protein
VTRKQFARSFHGEIRVGSADELVTNVRRLMEDRIASYIALANKAGQVISGSDAVAEALQHGQVGVVMMAADISADSAGRFTGLAQRNGTRIERVLDKERLGNLLGKELRSIVAVEKGRFAEVISRELEKYRNFCEGGADVR